MTTYEYKRDLSHNYLILTGESREKENYKIRMLERNAVHGILPCSVRYVDNKVKYYYDISSRQPLAAAFSIRKMSFEVINSIFRQLESAFEELGNYLLDSSHILLDMRYMYWDMEEEKIYLIYYPQQEEKEERIRKFAEELLNVVDYTDKEAVDAVYLFYQKATVENFTFSTAFSYFHEHTESRLTETDQAELNRTESKQEEEIYSEAKEAEPEEVLSVAQKKSDWKATGRNKRERNKTEQNKTEQIRSGLIFLASVTILAVVVQYILANYQFTEREILLGAGILAMFPVSYLIYRIQKRQRHLADEKTGYMELKESRREYAAGEKQKEYTEEKEAVHPKAEEASVRFFGDREEVSQQYGETTYFDAQGWQQERCLEGRFKGKTIYISIDQTPFIIGKLEGSVSYILNDITVSRMHAQFIEKDGKLFCRI
ncbi:MAG: FHA domain-containing protein [Clostridiales bacterium]|nr:FHA domain-containing protein [Clostridiales bacterium]